VIRPTDADARSLARGLVRGAAAAALATLGPGQAPLSTLTSVVADMDGAPVILVSALSAHTTNLKADPRACLLFSRTGKGDPLAHPRVSVSGVFEVVARDGAEHARIRAHFLSRQPKAELYVDFPDFAFLKLSVLSASLNGGFGRAYELGPADLLTDLSGCDALAEGEADIIAHMNDDHADAVRLMATALAGREPGPWRLASLDPEGFELASGQDLARLAFGGRVATPQAARVELETLARAARDTQARDTQEQLPASG
jgi:putative heme iron utilization protein